MIKNCTNCIHLEPVGSDFICKDRKYQYNFQKRDHLEMLKKDYYRNKSKSCCTKKEQTNDQPL